MTQPFDPQDFVCDLCGAEFGSVSELDDHKEEHRHAARARDTVQQTIHGDIGAAGLPGSPQQ